LVYALIRAVGNGKVDLVAYGNVGGGSGANVVGGVAAYGDVVRACEGVGGGGVKHGLNAHGYVENTRSVRAKRAYSVGYIVIACGVRIECFMSVGYIRTACGVRKERFRSVGYIISSSCVRKERSISVGYIRTACGVRT
jgi:hypothetical protein